MKDSPFFILIFDETTDIAVVKDVIVYAHYLDQKRKVQTSFIAMSANLFHCNERGCGWLCRHHYGGLRKLCGDHELNMDKLKRGLLHWRSHEKGWVL